MTASGGPDVRQTINIMLLLLNNTFWKHGRFKSHLILWLAEIIKGHYDMYGKRTVTW